MIGFLWKRGFYVYLVSFSLIVEYSEHFREPILIFGMIYEYLTIYYYKINFNPMQLIEKLVDNQDTQSNICVIRRS